MNQPPLITEYGKRLLGEILRESREGQGWSLDDLVYEVKSRTGCKLSKTALHNLERGYSAPTWDTVAILANVGFVNVSGKSLTAHDMLDIACEQFAVPGQRTRIQNIRRKLSPKAADEQGAYSDMERPNVCFMPA